MPRWFDRINTCITVHEFSTNRHVDTSIESMWAPNLNMRRLPPTERGPPINSGVEYRGYAKSIIERNFKWQIAVDGNVVITASEVRLLSCSRFLKVYL